MATKLSLLSLAVEAENGSSWTWNPRNPNQKDEEDDSNWEVQAFAEDYTGSTWPPKSYSCSFCKREFRSAQALGGHMNVHRRDRASRRIHRPIPPRPAAAIAATSGRLIPADQELNVAGNGGMCHFYQLPCQNRDYRTNGVFISSENSTKNVKSYSGGEDLDLELRLGR